MCQYEGLLNLMNNNSLTVSDRIKGMKVFCYAGEKSIGYLYADDGLHNVL
jgi:hypothetical protein